MTAPAPALDVDVTELVGEMPQHPCNCHLSDCPCAWQCDQVATWGIHVHAPAHQIVNILVCDRCLNTTKEWAEWAASEAGGHCECGVPILTADDVLVVIHL